MELHDWLLSQGFIEKNHEYAEIVRKQIMSGIRDLRISPEGLVEKVPQDLLSLCKVERHPIGEVIDNLDWKEELFERVSVSNLQELVAEWQQWHVKFLEPIGHHSTSCRFGRNLYKNQIEKKLVASFLTQAPVRDMASIILDGDTVALPEGSSSFYVGLAIAAFRENVSIISSNGALFTEYLANLKLASAFNQFTVIGGLAHMDSAHQRPDHAGTFGPDAQEQYANAIQERPGATVVVMPVNGFVAESGPYAVGEEVRALKRQIILSSIDALDPTRNVRELVFVADYTKHLQSKARDFGVPVFGAVNWQELLVKSRSRISLVTVPPPALRQRLVDDCNSQHPACRNALAYEGISHECREYNSAAHSLGSSLYDQAHLPRFYEALTVDHEKETLLARTAMIQGH